MPELSKEFIDQFLADKEWIEGKVQEVVTRMYDIRSTEPPCSFHVDEIDATIIALSGEETWQYGGRECYQLSIPTSYLYDPDWESAYRLKVERARSNMREDEGERGRNDGRRSR